jgi:MFS family permease
VTALVLSLNRRAFVSLHKYRNYRLFFSGQIVSLTGTWMHRVAQAWLVLMLTHSPIAVGILAVAQFLPFTLFGLPFGVLVDRLDAHRTVIATQAANMVLGGVLAAIVYLGVAEPWHVYVIAALMGTVTVLDAPSRQALTYRMVGRSELPNAVALNSSIFNAARIFGPALGGVIIAAAGVGACFAINSASYLAVLAGLLLMRPSEFYALERREPPRLLRGMREGLSYVRRQQRALVVLALVLVVSTFCFNFNVLLPVLAKRTLHSGPETFGILSAAFGAGALVGALVTAVSGRASMRWLLLAAGGYGAVLLFATGLCFTVWTANANSALQLEAPDHLRGRVVGLYYFAFNGFGALGGLLAGWMAARGGTTLAFAFAGALSLLTALLAATVVRGRAARTERPPLEEPLDQAA